VKRLGLLVAFVASLLALPAMADPSTRWQQPEFILQAFKEVALRNEYSRKGHMIRRWNQPVRVWLDHQVPDAEIHTQVVQMHLDHLAQITGLSIKLVPREKDANLRVVFTKQSLWKKQVGKLFGKRAEKIVHGAVCMANFRVNKRYEIVQAGVIIPVDQARMHGKLVTCIVEEITQVMGLPNDSEKVYPSIFNDRTPEALLSGLDYLLLKMLYRPEIKAGMREGEALAALRKVVSRWQGDGTIKSARKNVRRGELYPLLGY